ncbi:hypothetical protein PROPEN_02529 [Proteus penneri ATCC 35198]|nr:hypothetical protein PROPEN_02529 [Proteus penneri ATCC 35198]
MIFYITFTDCSTAINQISVTFSGISDAADINSLYKNQGTAKKYCSAIRKWARFNKAWKQKNHWLLH